MPEPQTRNRIENQLDSLLKWRLKIDRDIEKFDHTLFGNGSPGMDEVIRRVVSFIDKQEKREAERWSDAKKFAIGIIAVIINTIIAVLISKAFGQ